MPAFSQEEFGRREGSGFFPLKCGRNDKAASEEIEKESLKSESVGNFDQGERKERGIRLPIGKKEGVEEEESGLKGGHKGERKTELRKRGGEEPDKTENCFLFEWGV